MNQTEMWDVPQYFYCTKHDRVEPTEGCPNRFRLGPYETEQEAQSALVKAAQRTEEWDEEDRRWRGDEEE